MSFYGKETKRSFFSRTSSLRREWEVRGTAWTSQSRKQVVPGAKALSQRRSINWCRSSAHGDFYPRSPPSSMCECAYVQLCLCALKVHLHLSIRVNSPQEGQCVLKGDGPVQGTIRFKQEGPSRSSGPSLGWPEASTGSTSTSLGTTPKAVPVQVLTLILSAKPMVDLRMKRGTLETWATWLWRKTVWLRCLCKTPIRSPSQEPIPSLAAWWWSTKSWTTWAEAETTRARRQQHWQLSGLWGCSGLPSEHSPPGRVLADPLLSH